jgi:acetoin:2,6-dichlorophenolindophenol oxidoreductase subunit beta
MTTTVRRLRMRQAIAEALADEMAADPAVVLLGEDVGAAGGVFKTSEGLLDRFGPLRVRDTPISEMGFLGAAAGAAAAGLRPVVEIMFAEFVGVALDQLVTEAAKLRYLSRGEYTAPLVVRMSAGPGLGFGAQHSQTLEGWFTGTPGLKVVSPSGARAAYGLLRAAIRDDDPVVFIEPRVLYGEREEAPTGDGAVAELGRASVLRPEIDAGPGAGVGSPAVRPRADVGSGADVTIVALGQTVRTAVEAADGAGWSAEVVDLQTLVPWDRETVLESVRRTGRLVTVEANPMRGGWGTELAAVVATEAFGQLRAPVLRVTCPDVPVPFAPALESRYLPEAGRLRTAVTELVAHDRPPRPWWEEEPVA